MNFVKMPTICGKCSEDSVNEKNKIVCDLCKTLFHWGCCGLSKSELFCLRANERKILYICDTCRCLLPTVIKHNKTKNSDTGEVNQKKIEENSEMTEEREDSLKIRTSPEIGSSTSLDSDSQDSTPSFISPSCESPELRKKPFNFEANGHFNDKNYSKTRRIQELHLTLERFVDYTSDTEKNEQIKRPKSAFANLCKFQNYVKMVPKYQEPVLTKDDSLFYCCLIVDRFTDKPKIMFKFPHDVEIPAKIEDLCYPETASGPFDISGSAQCYSLVITDDKGERTFGYCRRIIPEGSSRCIPLTYCILSKHRAPRFYKKILTELESSHGIPYKMRDELVSKLYYHKFPQPGQSIEIHVTEDSNGVQNEENDPTTKIEVSSLQFTLNLHPDIRYEEADLKPLHTLPSHILLKIFASLLLERKVILISCVISKLSSCVDALQSILYPFSWPHTFIPVLPQSLWDIVESPTPVVCGILSVSVVNEHEIEYGIVVDLDTENIMIEEGDEDNILSPSMKKLWYQGINAAQRNSHEDYSHSVSLSDAYISVFILALKHYKNHIVNNTFEKDAFIMNGRSKGIKGFLKWFTGTNMFLSFIEAAINNPNSFSLFDEKIASLESDKSKPIFRKYFKVKKTPSFALKNDK